MINKCCLFLVFLICSGCILAQQYNFRNYLPKVGGLSQSQVYDIIQDQSGYIWVATYGGGVCRFDGEIFTTFNRINNLSNDEVICLTLDEEGAVWVGTRKGINIIRNGKVQLPDSTLCIKTIQTKEIRDLEFLDDGRLVILVKNGNQYIWDGSQLDFFKLPSACNASLAYSTGMLMATKNHGLYYINHGDTTIFDKKNGLPSNTVNCLTPSSDSSVWVGTAAGIVLFKDGKLHHDQLTNELNSKKPDIRSVSFRNNKLAIGTAQAGVYEKDLNGSVLHLRYENGLPVSEIRKVYIDREGYTWIGTNGAGLVAHIHSAFSQYNFSVEGNDQIRTITAIDSQRIYCSTFKGIYMIKNDSVQKISDDIVRGIDGDSFGRIWLVHKEKGLCRLTDNVISSVELKASKPSLSKIVNKINNEPTIVDRALSVNSLDQVWFGTQKGFGLIDNKNELVSWFDKDSGLTSPGGVLSFHQDSTGQLWIGCGNGLYLLHEQQLSKIDRLMNFACYCIREDQTGHIWCATDHGVFKISRDQPNTNPIVSLDQRSGLSSSMCYTLEINNRNQVLIGNTIGIDKLDATVSNSNDLQILKHFDSKHGFKGVECNANSSCKTPSGSIWFGTIKGVYKYNESNDVSVKTPPNIALTSIRLNYETIDKWITKSGIYLDLHKADNPILFHDQNHLTFEFVGISMVNHDEVSYSFRLEGYEDKWSPSTFQNSITYSNLNPGDYIFHVKVFNADGIESDPIVFSFSIASPFWKTAWFSLLTLTVIIAGSIITIKLRERQLKFANLRLERKIQVRTSQLEEEKLVVEEQHNEITKSINYAKRIQYSILPEQELMEAYFEDFFVFYHPKDIVGGDFYWYRCFGNLSVIATVDCTGHGVPGGFMSMMGSLLLDKIVQKNNLDTSNILIELNKEIIRVLDQTSGGEIQDGMDIAICIVNKKERIVHFSGARNGIIAMSDSKIKRYDADLYSVGGSYTNKSKKINRQFKSQQIELQKGDWVFMYSDGFYDQLGDSTYQSLGMAKFEKILAACAANATGQHQILMEEFNSWKGNLPQIDDLLVLGFRI